MASSPRDGDPIGNNQREAMRGQFLTSPDSLIGGYMIFYSVGSAIGAIAATAIYARSGWPGISFLGTTFSGVALAIWITPIFSERRSRNSSSLGLLEEERFGRLTAVQTSSSSRRETTDPLSVRKSSMVGWPGAVRHLYRISCDLATSGCQHGA